MCTGTTSSGTTTISTAQAAALQQLAAQRQAAAARANAATTANLRAALMQTNALLAAQQSNPTLFTMQVRQQNPYVIALLQRQAALTAALQR
jgi:C4-dicarboxylate transporter